MSYPHQLSGGQLQRIMIAIALINDPRLLLADEPTTALDVTIQAQILDLMRELNEKNGTAILFITHDMGVIRELCDNMIVMYAGRMVEKAAVEVLFEHPLHPYSEGLIRAVPQITKERGALYSIDGSVPNPTERFEGCPFCPRCPKAMEICAKRCPAAVPAGEGREVACWLYAGAEGGC
jgi:oligopeptide/dipeptide ABC transporter ATP-binding protein